MSTLRRRTSENPKDHADSLAVLIDVGGWKRPFAMFGASGSFIASVQNWPLGAQQRIRSVNTSGPNRQPSPRAAAHPDNHSPKGNEVDQHQRPIVPQKANHEPAQNPDKEQIKVPRGPPKRSRAIAHNLDD